MPFWFAYIFTIIAVFGIINALNMIDGLDGLASGLGLVTLLILMAFTNNSEILTQHGIFLVATLTAFLLFNFKATPFLPKVFLGDAGSKLIGLTLVWVIIEAAKSGSQNTGGLNPSTALFIVGLPLIDMVTTTVRRIKKGHAPFNPDSTHIHHVLQRAGLGKFSALLTILLLALAINFFGIALMLMNIPDSLQFVLFFCCYYIYSYNIHHAWRLSKRLKKVIKSPKRIC